MPSGYNGTGITINYSPKFAKIEHRYLDLADAPISFFFGAGKKRQLMARFGNSLQKKAATYGRIGNLWQDVLYVIFNDPLNTRYAEALKSLCLLLLPFHSH